MTLTTQRMQGISGALQQQQQQQQQQQPSSTAAAAGACAATTTVAAAVPRQPLLTGCADSVSRMTAVLRAMSGDLLGRVMLDR